MDYLDKIISIFFLKVHWPEYSSCMPLLSISEPTNMLDMKAIIWLENYLQVNVFFIESSQ